MRNQSQAQSIPFKFQILSSYFYSKISKLIYRQGSQTADDAHQNTAHKWQPLHIIII